MSAKFKDYLVDLLTTLGPFKDAITTVMVREAEGGVKAAAKSREGGIAVQIRSKGEVSDFRTKACFGSLPFLLGALTVSHMDDGEIEFNYGLASNDKDEVLRSMKLKGARRYNVFYRAIDPFVNQLNRIKLPPNLHWPVAFAIDESFINSFDEVHKVNSLAPKTGGERDDLFQLVYTEDGIEAIFGDPQHQTNVILSPTVEAENGAGNLNGYYSISRFRSLLRLIGKGTAIGYLSDKSLRVDIETSQSEYQFVLAGMKVVVKS